MLTCFHGVNVTVSHQTPPHCLGPSLKVPGTRAATLQERQGSAGRSCP